MSLFPPKQLQMRDGNNVTLRSSEIADAPQMIAYLDALRHEADGIMFSPEDELPTLQWEENWVRENREGRGVQIIAEDQAGQQIAMCSIGVSKLARPGHYGNVGISIRQAWCGRGLGTALMNELVTWAKAQDGIDVLQLGVFADNPQAQRVYEKVGFTPDGVRRWSVRRGDRYVDEVLMSRWVGASPPPRHEPRT